MATDTKSPNLPSTIATVIMTAISITTGTTTATTIVSSTMIAMIAHHVLRVGTKERKPDGEIATCLQVRRRSLAAMTMTAGMIGTGSSTMQPALGRTTERQRIIRIGECRQQLQQQPPPRRQATPGQ